MLGFFDGFFIAFLGVSLHGDSKNNKQIFSENKLHISQKNKSCTSDSRRWWCATTTRRLYWLTDW
jgi:hypothetical protein